MAKKKILEIVITLFAVTTAFNLGNNILNHGIQMYVLSALVVYYLWIRKNK